MKFLLLLLAFALIIGGAYAAYDALSVKTDAGSNLQFVGDAGGTQSGGGSSAPSVQNPILQNPPTETPPAEDPPAETPPTQTPPIETPSAETPPTETPSAESDPSEGDSSPDDQTQKPPEALPVTPPAAPTVKDFTVYDKSGKAVKLSDYFGKPIVLNFFATWCQPCRNEMPYFQSQYVANREEIQFLFISLDDSLSEAEKFLKKQGYTFPILHDLTGSASVAFKVTTIPTTFFIDRDGNLVAWAVGTLKYSDLTLGISKIK